LKIIFMHLGDEKPTKVMGFKQSKSLIKELSRELEK